MVNITPKSMVPGHKLKESGPFDSLTDEQLQAMANNAGNIRLFAERMAFLGRANGDIERVVTDEEIANATKHELVRMTAREKAKDQYKPGGTELSFTKASSIRPRRTVWLKAGWVPVGALTLLAGVEGTGKSTMLYDMTARVTRGTMPGEFFGQPKSVLVAATEDDWAATITPRLLAAGADLERVYRVETESRDGLVFPRDNDSLVKAAEELDVALLVLDPLISRLGDADTHKDSEVRKGLEPLVASAHAGRFSIVGIIHLNKNEQGKSILNRVMGSKAFAAVARAVIVVMDDPDSPPGSRSRLFGIAKSNLGKDDLPAERFEVVSRKVTVYDPYTDLPVETEIGAVEMRTGLPLSIAEAIAKSEERSTGRDKSAAAVQAENALYMILEDGLMPLKDAVAAVVGNTGLDRKTVYNAADTSSLLTQVKDPEDGRRMLIKRIPIPGTGGGN